MPRPHFHAIPLRSLCPPRPSSTPFTLLPRRLLSDLSPAQPHTTTAPPPTEASTPTTSQKVTRILPASLTTPTPPKAPPQPTPSAAPSPPIIPREPYIVARTASNNLPVYEQTKRGGSLKETLVRRVSGDSEALRTQLAAVLVPVPKNVKVNTLTRHVVVKGFYRVQVEKFLREKGF